MKELSILNSEEVLATINEQADLMNNAASVLIELLHNTYGLLQELADFSESFYQHDKEIENQSKEAVDKTLKLTDYIEHCHQEIEALAEAIKTSDLKIKMDKKKIIDLQTNLEETKQSIEQERKNDTQLNLLKKEAIQQSTFTATMGSVLGSMLWKTSKTEDVINTLIHEEMIEDFLNIANMTLNSFIETYTNELPMIDSREFKYAMSILGVSVNISAHKDAREVVLNERIGIIFINHVMEHLKSIKMPQGRLLTKMCLMFLYNMSISKRGAILIHQNKTGVENIMDCLGIEYTSEIQSVVLSLMSSLLEEIPTKEFLHQIIRLTTRENLQRLMQHEDEDLQYLSHKFYKKLNKIESSASS